MEWGTLLVSDVEGNRSFGREGSGGPQVQLTVDHARFYSKALLGGSIGVGESYVDGDWSCDDLSNLTRIFVRNLDLMQGVESGWARMSKPIHKIYHSARRNTRRGSRSNIEAHYDLGNEFYRLFLDETMTYSCGYFENEKATLEEASQAKYDRLCRKLRLKPGDHVLEIGTGWGGFACHAATHYGCRVTTTTISQNQYDYSRAIVNQRSLSDRVRVIKEDYRDLEGKFDKLVSIEMIEAVGHEFLEDFLGRCAERLKPDGLMALQAITIADPYYESHTRTVDFIKRYVFPGSCLVSVPALVGSASRATDLHMFHLEDISSHYVRTLRLWRERFLSNSERVRELGFPDSFLRLWEYYLATCEGSFAERYTGDVQVLFAKPLYREEKLA